MIHYVLAACLPYLPPEWKLSKAYFSILFYAVSPEPRTDLGLQQLRNKYLLPEGLPSLPLIYLCDLRPVIDQSKLPQLCCNLAS